MARLGYQVGIEVRERMIPRFLAMVSVALWNGRYKRR